MITKCTQMTTQATYTVDVIIEKTTKSMKKWFDNPKVQFQLCNQNSQDSSSGAPVWGITGLVERNKERFDKLFLCTGIRSDDYWTGNLDEPTILPASIAKYVIAASLGESSCDMQQIDKDKAVFETEKRWSETLDPETWVRTYTMVISRGSVGTLRDVFEAKGVQDYQIITMHGDSDDELKPYENIAGRALTKLDAVVISRCRPTKIERLIRRWCKDDHPFMRELERRLLNCFERDDFIAEITQDAYIPTAENTTTVDMLEYLLAAAGGGEDIELELE